MKSGLDFFPLDVSFEDKVKLIEAEFGLQGFAVIVKLWQKVYSVGYYCEWTSDVALLFSQEVRLGCNVVSEIVAASIRRGIFDSELYDKYRILTSAGIQKRYFEACSRRKEVKVINEYLLVKCDNFLKNVNIIAENVNISSENVNISPENVNINQQSKVEDSRVDESIADINTTQKTKHITSTDKLTTTTPDTEIKTDVIIASFQIKGNKELFITEDYFNQLCLKHKNIDVEKKLIEAQKWLAKNKKIIPSEKAAKEFIEAWLSFGKAGIEKQVSPAPVRQATNYPKKQTYKSGADRIFEMIRRGDFDD